MKDSANDKTESSDREKYKERHEKGWWKGFPPPIDIDEIEKD